MASIDRQPQLRQHEHEALRALDVARVEQRPQHPDALAAMDRSMMRLASYPLPSRSPRESRSTCSSTSSAVDRSRPVVLTSSRCGCRPTNRRSRPPTPGQPGPPRSPTRTRHAPRHPSPRQRSERHHRRPPNDDPPIPHPCQSPQLLPLAAEKVSGVNERPPTVRPLLRPAASSDLVQAHRLQNRCLGSTVRVRRAHSSSQRPNRYFTRPVGVQNLMEPSTRPSHLGCGSRLKI
jgi:hypothetical protein